MNSSVITSWFTIFDWSPTDPRWEQRRKATWAWRKFKKARRWARVLRFVPFVRMIAIGNSLGYGNCSPESDIDLVIVTAPRRIWTVRLLVVALLRLFRQRPGEHTRDAICPSFFLTTEALDLESLQIEECKMQNAKCKMPDPNHSSFCIHHSACPGDPYLLFWLTQLTVLSDVGDTYDQFWRENEAWVQRWLPDARPRAIHPRLCVGKRGNNKETSAKLPLRRFERAARVEKSRNDAIEVSRLHFVSLEMTGFAEVPKGFLPLFQGGSERGCTANFGDLIERWSRRFQERRFSPEIRALANQDSRVIVNDRMLKFHTNDRRAHYRDRWVRRLAANESSVSA